jgi:hypothetical protein
MKIDDAIKSLMEVKKRGVKNIIFAHWEADLFDKVDDKDWEWLCDFVDNKMDWGNAYDNIVAVMDEINATTAEGIYARNQKVMESFFDDPRYEDDSLHFELADEIIIAMLKAEGIEELAEAVEDSLKEQIIDGLT